VHAVYCVAGKVGVVGVVGVADDWLGGGGKRAATATAGSRDTAVQVRCTAVLALLARAFVAVARPGDHVCERIRTASVTETVGGQDARAAPPPNHRSQARPSLTWPTTVALSLADKLWAWCTS
jgi:hypothetical protein